MGKAIVRFIIMGIAIWCSIKLIPGFAWSGDAGNELVALLVVTLVMALLNMLVKPVIQVLSLPITILTLGLFSVIINTFVLYLTSWISSGLFGVGFSISSFWVAIVAAIVISVVTLLLNSLFRVNDQKA